MVGGYGRDITGEVGVLCFTAGQVPLLPLRLLLPYLVALKPSQPLQWARFVRDAYRHGHDTPSLACVDYEALLPRPLAEARREIGIATLRDAHPHGVPEKGWLLDRLERPVQGLAGALRPNHGEHDRPEATALVCPALVAELA